MTNQVLTIKLRARLRRYPGVLVVFYLLTYAWKLTGWRWLVTLSIHCTFTLGVYREDEEAKP